ncbi:MAG: hypothetical protein ABIH21_01660 [Patescibacteria group bacterium]
MRPQSKKLLLIPLLILIFCLFIVPSTIHAQSGSVEFTEPTVIVAPPPTTEFVTEGLKITANAAKFDNFEEGKPSTNTAATISNIVATYASILIGLTGIIFVVLLIYAGILWMTAMGDGEKVTKSKKLMGSAIIGIVIVIAAYSATLFVFNIYQAGMKATQVTVTEEEGPGAEVAPMTPEDLQRIVENMERLGIIDTEVEILDCENGLCQIQLGDHMCDEPPCIDYVNEEMLTEEGARPLKEPVVECDSMGYCLRHETDGTQTLLDPSGSPINIGTVIESTGVNPLTNPPEPYQSFIPAVDLSAVSGANSITDVDCNDNGTCTITYNNGVVGENIPLNNSVTCTNGNCTTAGGTEVRIVDRVVCDEGVCGAVYTDGTVSETYPEPESEPERAGVSCTPYGSGGGGMTTAEVCTDIHTDGSQSAPYLVDEASESTSTSDGFRWMGDHPLYD